MSKYPTDSDVPTPVMRGRILATSGALDPNLRVRPLDGEGHCGEDVPIDSRGGFALTAEGVAGLEVLDRTGHVLCTLSSVSRGRYLEVQLPGGVPADRVLTSEGIDPPTRRPERELSDTLQRHLGDPRAGRDVEVALAKFLSDEERSTDGVVAGYLAALWLDEQGRDDLATAELVARFRERLPDLRGRRGRGSSGIPDPRGPFGPGQRDPLLDAVEECAREAVRTLPDPQEQRISIGSIQPSVICGSQETKVTIKPSLPGGLGDRTHEVVLTSNGSSDLTLEIVTWSRDEAQVKIPVEAHSGTVWIRPPGAGISRDCLRILGRFGGAPNEHWLNIATRNAAISRGVFIELVQPPVMEFLSVDGRYPRAAVEACQPTTVAWQANFGNPATRAADNISLHRIRVTLSVSGTPVAIGLGKHVRPSVGLEHEGSAEMVPAVSKLFPLVAKAESRLDDGTVCGTDTRLVLVLPYEKLELAVPKTEILAGETLDVTIRRSCAPDRDLIVSLSYDGPLSGQSEVTIPSGSRQTIFRVKGEVGCDIARIVANADHYENDELDLMVVERPEVLSLAPVGSADVVACEPRALTIHVGCLDLDTARVRVKGPSDDVIELGIDAIQGNILTTKPLDTPEWSTHEVTVASRGLWSEPTLLVVKSPMAMIEVFTAENLAPLLNDTAVPCTVTTARLRWRVRGALRVTIKNTVSGAEIEDYLVSARCGADSGTKEVLIDGPTSWEIKVQGVVGEAMQQTELAPAHSDDVLSKVVIHFDKFDPHNHDPDRTPEVYRIWRWKHGTPVSSAEDFGDHHMDSAPVIVDLPDTCATYDVVVVGVTTLNNFNNSSVFEPIGFSDPKVIQFPTAHASRWLNRKAHPDGKVAAYTMPAYP